MRLDAFAVTLFLVAMLVPPLATSLFVHFSPVDPGHLEWCQSIDFRNESSCIFDHWGGRLKLLAIWFGGWTFFGLFMVGAKADVDRRFARIEAEVSSRPIRRE